MTSERTEFRYAILRAVFLGHHALLLAAVLVGLLCLAILVIVPSGPLFAYDYGASAATFLAIALFSFYLSQVARRWFAARRQLYYGEHFLVLVVVSLHSGAIFGLLTFLLFQMSPKHISVTPKLVEELSYRDSILGARRVAASIATIRLAQPLRTTIHDLAYPELGLSDANTATSGFTATRGGHVYRIALPKGAPRLTVLDKASLTIMPLEPSGGCRSRTTRQQWTSTH